MKCLKCQRKIPNKTFTTLNGCKWCDGDYKKPQPKYKGIIAFDFDATLATYKRPFKFDKLGRPQKNVIEALRHFYDRGYYILIFTGRKKTKKMEQWLKKYKVPYHGYNIQPKPMKDADNYKPMYDVLVDDKAVNQHYKYNKKSLEELITDITLKLTWSKEGKDE